MDTPDPFGPTWAREKPPTPPNPELDLLRDFFDAWTAFHALPHDKMHRAKREAAAQTLTDAAQSVIRFRDPLGKLHAH